MPGQFTSPTTPPGFAPTGMLDGPPPNPMIAGPQQLPGAMGAGPTGTSRQLPPEVLQGLLQAGNTVMDIVNSMASMVPDLAGELALVQSGMQQFLSKVNLAGGGPTTQAQAGTPMPNGIPPSPSPSS